VIIYTLYLIWPNPVPAQPKAWVCGCLHVGLAGPNSIRGMVVCCECCGVSEYDDATQIRLWPTRSCCAMKRKYISNVISLIVAE